MRKEIYILTFLLIIVVVCVVNPLKEHFHFEVTPEKLCAGGPYMYSSASPAKREYCESLSRGDYCRYNCQRGFVGMPLAKFEYSTTSDSNWENRINTNGSLYQAVL